MSCPLWQAFSERNTMEVKPHIRIVSRDDLASALVPSGHFSKFAPASVRQIGEVRIPPSGAIVGFWTTPGSDPFPDFLVVDDDSVSDTHAWLAAFMTSMAPVTQWCRVWPQSKFAQVVSLGNEPVRATHLAPWVGAIIAECSAQSLSAVNLAEMNGISAMTSASFAAARSLFVLPDYADIGEVARRHDDMSQRLSIARRPLSARQLLPIWSSLSGNKQTGRQSSDFRTLQIFSDLFHHAGKTEYPTTEFIEDATRFVAREFDIGILIECGNGPQSNRVKALDHLADQLLSGPSSPAIEALLGFGASLIDPGAAVLPELLRRYTMKMPTSAVWLGSFAGIWSPVRVLSDFRGLGRFVAKHLLDCSDIFSKPRADIAFEEIDRWIGSTPSSSIPVRGSAARTLDIELMPGVTCTFPVGRAPSAKQSVGTSSRQEALNLGDPIESGRRQTRQNGDSSMLLLARSVDDVIRRLEALEKSVYVSSNSSPKRGTKPTASKRDKT
jgi:hypothetical protein